MTTTPEKTRAVKHWEAPGLVVAGTQTTSALDLRIGDNLIGHNNAGTPTLLQETLTVMSVEVDSACVRVRAYADNVGVQHVELRAGDSVIVRID